MQKRFRQFAEGQWEALIQFARDVSEVASGAMVRRRRRRASDDAERRAARAHVFVQMGELSSGRAALEAAEVAPGSEETLQQLQNPVRRPPRPREPIPQHLLEHNPRDQFELDEEKFLQNVRSARRGAAGGPSGMTSEHLRILLENVRDGHAFFLMGQQGVVASDVVRRLVSRTITQQLNDAALAATSPFQYALSTRAGCECIAHALQSLSELDPNATILSIDGIGAFDLVSRGAMLQGLANLCPAALPFVRQFYGSPSHYIWEDDAGVVHDVAQGEGGEQGDPMMPLLFSLGQHAALMAVQRQLAAHEKVFAFLDDVYVVTSPDRVLAVYTILQAELWRHSRIRVHDGKTQVWNASGLRPDGCDILDRAGRAVNPNFDTVWCGDGPTNTRRFR